MVLENSDKPEVATHQPDNNSALANEAITAAWTKGDSPAGPSTLRFSEDSNNPLVLAMYDSTTTFECGSTTTFDCGSTTSISCGSTTSMSNCNNPHKNQIPGDDDSGKGSGGHGHGGHGGGGGISKQQWINTCVASREGYARNLLNHGKKYQPGKSWADIHREAVQYCSKGANTRYHK